MKSSNQPIEKKLRFRLFLTLFIFAVIGVVCGLILDPLLSRYGNPITDWIVLRLDVFLFLYLVCGYSIIFFHYWKKPWFFLEEIIKGTQTIYEENDHTIELSDPLYEIENQMNQIKMSVLLNKQAANEAENKKNELVMYLAHDIRTPLTTIIGYLSLLREAPDMPVDQHKKYIEIVFEKAERLQSLIDELFEITRFNTKSVYLKKETVDLGCLLIQLIDEFFPTLTARGNFATLNAEEQLYVLGAPEKLARAFGNLLKNAAAYSYPDTEILVDAKCESNNAVITISNHGATIPYEQIAAIFQKFHRLDDARLSNTGGTGLGLPIAQEIVGLHGGQIEAHSENETISFTVRLPLLS